MTLVKFCSPHEELPKGAASPGSAAGRSDGDTSDSEFGGDGLRVDAEDDHRPMVEAVLLDFYGRVVHEDDVVIDRICAAISQTASAQATPKEIRPGHIDATALPPTGDTRSRLLSPTTTASSSPCLAPGTPPQLPPLRSEAPLCEVQTVTRYAFAKDCCRSGGDKLHVLVAIRFAVVRDTSNVQPGPSLFPS